MNFRCLLPGLRPWRAPAARTNVKRLWPKTAAKSHDTFDSITKVALAGSGLQSAFIVTAWPFPNGGDCRFRALVTRPPRLGDGHRHGHGSLPRAPPFWHLCCRAGSMSLLPVESALHPVVPSLTVESSSSSSCELVLAGSSVSKGYGSHDPVLLRHSHTPHAPCALLRQPCEFCLPGTRASSRIRQKLWMGAEAGTPAIENPCSAPHAAVGRRHTYRALDK